MVKGIKARGDKFHMVLENPECVNVSFWYVPNRLRGIPHNEERIKELGRVSIMELTFKKNLIEIC